MSRRPGNHPSRRHGDSGGEGAASLFAFSGKSRTAPYFPIVLIVLGSLLIFAYLYRGSGRFVGHKRAIGRIEGDFTCKVEVQRAIPVLKKAYGDSMRKVLHVGPYTCPVFSKLEKEEETEAWGIEPYDIEDVDGHCQSLVQKRHSACCRYQVSSSVQAKFIFSCNCVRCVGLLVSKIPQQNSSRFGKGINEGLVVFTGFPGQHRAKVVEVSKFGIAASDLIVA